MLPHIELMQSFQEANWYKPEPGEPYRPLIAMPNKLKEMIPWFSHCHDELFTAYDPPSALTLATALAPPLPLSNPTSHPWAPAPSPTMDTGAGHIVGAEASTPVPASIPTVDQPEATNTAAPVPPKQEGPNPQSQPNDPANQESPSSQSRPNTEPDSDPKGGNDPHQNSDPHQDSSPEQGSSSSGAPGQEADPKPSSDPNQVNSNQGSNQNADPVPQDDPKQENDANHFSAFTEGHAQTINNQVVQPLSHGISVAGTTLTPGAPPITVSGTLIHFGSIALVVGTSTAPLVSGDPSPITTTIAGHVITAAPNAIAVADTTLTRGAPPITVSGTPIHFGASALVVGTTTVPLAPEIPTQIVTTIAGQAITAGSSAVAIAGNNLSPGAPGTTIDGTILSLNTAGQFVVGSKTIPLGSQGPETITTTIGGQVITAAPNKLAIGGTALTPGASGVTVGGTLVSLNTAGQLIVGSKTIALPSGSIALGGQIVGGLGVGASEVANPITTTIDGQIITAGPTALAMAGTTLTPGAPGFTINGTLVSLNTAAQLIVGSKTIPLESENGGSSGQTADLGGLIVGGFGNEGPFGPFGTNSPSPALGNNSAAIGNGTSNGTTVFEGKAGNLTYSLSWNGVVVSTMAIFVLFSMY